MGWLVLETFVLMLIYTAFGIALGVVARTAWGAFRHEPVTVHVGGVIEAPPAAPVTVTVSHPGVAAAVVEPVFEPGPVPANEESAALAPTEAVIDPDKAAVADQVGLRPGALAGPRDGRPDDLKRIRGIGPHNEARLNALGVYHLDQIAAWSQDEARWVGSYLAFPGRIEREDWVGQAKGQGEGQ